MLYIHNSSCLPCRCRGRQSVSVILSIRLDEEEVPSQLSNFSSSQSYLQIVVVVVAAAVSLLVAALVVRCCVVVVVIVIVIIMIIVALVLPPQIPKAFA